MYGNKLETEKNGQTPGRIQAIPQLAEVEIKNPTRLIKNKKILIMFFFKWHQSFFKFWPVIPSDFELFRPFEIKTKHY